MAHEPKHGAEVSPQAGDPKARFNYPRLMWSPDHVEITVRSDAERQQMVAQGYLDTPPAQPQTLVATPQPVQGLSGQ